MLIVSGSGDSVPPLPDTDRLDTDCLEDRSRA
jgi:hypothetical protein